VKYPFQTHNINENSDVDSFLASIEFLKIKRCFLRFSPTFEAELQKFSVQLESSVYWIPDFLLPCYEIKNNTEDDALYQEIKDEIRVCLSEESQENAFKATEKKLKEEIDKLTDNCAIEEFKTTKERLKDELKEAQQEEGNRPKHVREKISELVENFTDTNNLRKVLSHYRRYKEFEELTRTEREGIDGFVSFVYKKIFDSCKQSGHSRRDMAKPGVESSKSLLSYVVDKMARNKLTILKARISSIDFLSSSQFLDVLLAWIDKESVDLEKSERLSVCFELVIDENPNIGSVLKFYSNETAQKIAELTKFQKYKFFVVDRITNQVREMSFLPVQGEKTLCRSDSIKNKSIELLIFDIGEAKICLGIVSEEIKFKGKMLPLTFKSEFNQFSTLYKLTVGPKIFGRVASPEDMKNLGKKIINVSKTDVL
jgi:hypothetical protein